MLSVRVGIESVQGSILLMSEVSTCKCLSLVSESASEVPEFVSKLMLKVSECSYCLHLE